MAASINYVDLLLVLVVALGAASGWRRGFVLGAIDLLILAASVLLALVGYPHTARLFEKHVMHLGVWASPLAFLGIYILARLVLRALLSPLLAVLAPKTHAHPVNKVLGLLPGVVNGAIVATIFAMLLLALQLPVPFAAQARGSVLVNQLTVPAEWLEAQLGPVIEDATRSTMNRLTVMPGSREVVTLPFTVESPRARPDLEARMLQLVNEERAREGLAPLRPDPDLTEVARAHARDMFARGYFSHDSPEGKDAFDRMRQSQLRFLAAGENLALAQTLPMAHEGLMKSHGHRANILRPAFGRVGIGVMDGGARGLMVTQKFRN